MFRIATGLCVRLVMCGIVACFAHATVDQGDPVETLLSAGLDKIAHRGPDASGTWVSRDKRCAHQPVWQPLRPSPTLFSNPTDTCPISVIAQNIPPDVRAKMASWHPIHSAMYIWKRTPRQPMFELSRRPRGDGPFARSDDPVLGPPSHRVYQQTPYFSQEAVNPFVTAEVYKRRKHAYTAPVKYPVGGPIHQKLEELLTEAAVAKLGFVWWDEIERLKGQAFKGESAWAWRQLVVVAPMGSNRI